MRIQIASDLHQECLGAGTPGSASLTLTPGIDLLVLAGDIHTRTQVLGLYGSYSVPVLYVHGNHELFGSELFSLQHQLRANAAVTSVRYLERDEFVMEGVRFLGCCLWTDYELQREWKSFAMREAELVMNDHRWIRYGPSHAFSPRDAAAEHKKSRAWLESQLAIPFDGSTVVVTHHAPHPKSIPPEYTRNVLSASFASDLTPLVEQADVWIHGHVHHSADYTVGKCRVICNPRGYSRRYSENPTSAAFENPDFDPALVIDI